MRATPALLFSLILAACSHGSPCPPGHHESRTLDRCVPDGTRDDQDGGATGAPSGTLDADVEMDSQPPGADGEVGSDAELESIDASAGMDGQLPDGAGSDASPEDARIDVLSIPQSYDAGVSLITCNQTDGDAWLRFYSAPGMVNKVDLCFDSFGAGSATAATPNTAFCIMRLTQTDSCSDCNYGHARCTAGFCLEACDGSQSDATCRACMCEANCANAMLECYAHWAPADFCPASVYGPAPQPSDPALTTPLLLRERSSSGAYRAQSLASLTGPFPTTATRQFSRFFGAMATFPLNGREYAFQGKHDCRGYDCNRSATYAVQADGNLSYIAGGLWRAGRPEVDAFVTNGKAYVLAYGGMQNPGDSEAAGIIYTPQGSSLQLGDWSVGSFRASDGVNFDKIEPFKLGNDTYWLAYVRVRAGRDAAKGEVAFARFDASTEPPQLVRQAQTMKVADNIDVLETLKVNDRWLLFMYANSGTSGTAYLMDLVLDGGNVRVGSELDRQAWPRVITDAVGFVAGTQSQLLVQNANSGETALYTVGSNFKLSAAPSYTETAEAPGWDVFEVARQGKW